MKNFSILFVVLVIAALLGGCGTPDANETRKFGWSTHILLRYELATPASTIADEKVTALQTDIRTAMNDTRCIVQIHGTTLDIAIPYEGIDRLKFKSEKNTFYVMQTATFDNPLLYADVEVLVTTADLVVRGEEEPEGDGDVEIYEPIIAVTAKDTRAIFVLDLPVRATSVTGAGSGQIFSNEAKGRAEYRYYIYTDKEEIVAFWRFSNQTAWYIVGIIITIVFMAGIFSLLYVTNNYRKKQATESGTR